ncbi:MAG: DUF4349 domain-containing protein [Armatimonadetes bacterium]|nr:DUF4349 domain-containing protein [Armatimonadota bacterium]
MSNDDIRQDLKAFLDGELLAERAGEGRAALEADPSLREEAEFMKRLTGSFHAMTEGPEATPEASKAATARASGPGWKVLRRRWVLAVAGVGAAVVLAALLFPVFAQSKEKAYVTQAYADQLDSRAAGGVNQPPTSGEQSIGGAASDAGMPPRNGIDSESFAMKTLDAGPASPAGRPPEREMRGSRMPADSRSRPETFARQDPGTMPSPTLIEESFHRDVIRRAFLTMRVESVEQAESSVLDLVAGWGGYVENTQSNNLDSDAPTMSMTVRVPQSVFDDAIRNFETLGVRTEKRVSGEDVTARLVDMEARVKNLKSQEEVYRGILRKARGVGEVLDVQQRLTYIRGEIESLDAQAKTLGRLSALSTISLTLAQRTTAAATEPEEKQEDPHWSEDAWTRSSQGLDSALQSLGTAGIWTLVYAPIWLPLLFVGWLAVRFVSRPQT